MDVRLREFLFTPDEIAESLKNGANAATLEQLGTEHRLELSHETLGFIGTFHVAALNVKQAGSPEGTHGQTSIVWGGMSVFGQFNDWNEALYNGYLLVRLCSDALRTPGEITPEIWAEFHQAQPAIRPTAGIYTHGVQHYNIVLADPLVEEPLIITKTSANKGLMNLAEANKVADVVRAAFAKHQCLSAVRSVLIETEILPTAALDRAANKQDGRESLQVRFS